MPVLFLVFIVLPMAEIFTIVEVLHLIGGWDTIGLMLISAILGAGLLRRQGTLALVKVQEKAAQGEVPSTELLDASLLFLGGALMLVPGFITDLFGLLLLFRPVRLRLIRSVVSSWWQQFSGSVQSASGRYSYPNYSQFPAPEAGQSSQPPVRKGPDGHYVVDGECLELDD